MCSGLLFNYSEIYVPFNIHINENEGMNAQWVLSTLSLSFSLTVSSSLSTASAIPTLLQILLQPYVYYSGKICCALGSFMRNPDGFFWGVLFDSLFGLIGIEFPLYTIVRGGFLVRIATCLWRCDFVLGRSTQNLTLGHVDQWLPVYFLSLQNR